MAVYKYDSQNQGLKRVAGGTLYADCPIGSYIPFGGTVIPTGWLLCNGQAVSRTDYADLFAVIGTAYGSGDGSTTFNIPDLREAVPKGAGLTSKSNNHLDADGLAVGEFIDDRLQDHQHDLGNNNSSGPMGGTVNGWGGNNVNTGGVSVGRIGATTEVKSVGSNYIIKAKQIGAPADFVDAIDNVIEERFSYSTSEVNTGKKWIDGKWIYRKVVQKNIAITNGVDIDLSDIAIDTPISLDYVLQDGAGGSINAYNNTNITFNFYKSGSTNQAHILINTIGGWNLRQTTQNFIIEYTKTI